MVDEAKDDSSTTSGQPMKIPNIIYHTRDVVRGREKRGLVVPHAINSDIESEINADPAERQIHQVTRMFDREISGSLSMSRKDQQLTEEQFQGASQAASPHENILPAHLIRVRDFEVPQSSDEFREDAKVTYQLQFNRPENSQRYDKKPGIILNNSEILR